MQKVNSSNLKLLVLPADLTPDISTEFHIQVQSAIDSGISELKIDCSKIENATSSHIGILWKAYDTCNSQNVKLILEEATASLIKVLIILDLGELFGLGGYESKLPFSARVPLQSNAKDVIHTDLICVSRECLKHSLVNLLKFLRKHKVPSVTEFELRTIFYETITNIIDHSGLTVTDFVRFRAIISERKINLTFEDVGTQFDPTATKGAGDLSELITAAKGRKFKGFGLLMIRKLVDNILYERKENMINYLEIEKHWS